jgi:phosphate transport system permease protein
MHDIASAAEAPKAKPSKDAKKETVSERRARTFERDKRTRRGVLIGEKIANGMITVGGLLVIVAVAGIMVFLISVASRLWGDGTVYFHQTYELRPAKTVAWLNADEFGTMATRIAADGSISAFHLRTGTPLRTEQFDFGGKTATAVAGVLRRDQVAFGFEDGTIRFGDIDFDVTVVREGQLPANRQKLDAHDTYADGAVYTRLPTGDYRRVIASWAFGEPQQISEQPIIAINYRVGGTVERPTRTFATVDSESVARISRAVTQRNLLTSEEQIRLTSSTLPPLPPGTEVTRLLLSSQGDRVILATADGLLHRYDIRDAGNPVLAETARVFTGDTAITALAYLSAEHALIVGGSDGSVDVFFRLDRRNPNTTDGYELVRARVHEKQPAAITDIDVSQRQKAMATLDADGNVWIRHSTADRTLFKLDRASDAKIPAALMLMPRMNGVVLVDNVGETDYWAFNFPHPATTLKTLFNKIWYEGYSEPTYTWQSSSGTDVFEPKYSLIPLIFGTIKATVYAMLFAVPIALMGAIYTSEFVHRRVRGTVKPIMEMMESLPTVVLGFIAALILAPIVEQWIAAIMLGFIAIPLGLMLGAFIWQTLPPKTALKLEGIPKFLFMFGTIGAFTWISYQLGPLFEDVLFHGDFKAWVNGDVGTGAPFLFIIGLPLSFVAVGLGFSRLFGQQYRLYGRGLSKEAAGRIDLLRWLVMIVAAGTLSFAVASLLTGIGYDPRGGVVDTHAQRNALVVGFVMGFAIIPNIYTLAEDAMNAVPSHLRAASLAAGATPWQTAKWVILPVAASGVFSAVMIGMGRAVGETMIVVMAAGNTPILEWNIFSGLRTLSANIAVELPEAVKDGTLYRTLFLAALTLFLMTFVINTLAELVRQRFRKRAFQL